MSSYLYHQLEQRLREQIETGQLAPGVTLPSIRQLALDEQLSKATVLSAYKRL